MKYYTPTIEEFHVGFSFEDSTNDKEADWVQWYIADRHELAQALDILELHNCRVKRLDREDIESLGWEYMEKMVREEHDYEVLDCWEIPVDATENKEKYYVLFIYKEKLHIEYHEYQNSVGRTEDTLFKGTIKNKSELKTLLKWLKIN